MKKIVSALLASAIVASPVFANSTANSNFVTGTNGAPTEFVYQGRTYYQVSNPGIIVNTVGTTTTATGTAVTSTAVSTAAAAPATAASAGFAGGNIVGYVLGAAVLVGALSAATTSNH
jgi:hypothetical protein